MTEPATTTSKLQTTDRIAVPVEEARAKALDIFMRRGCALDEASEIAEHLIEADMCGIESHGIVRVLQYAREYDAGLLRAGAALDRRKDGPAVTRFEANGGIGIRAMRQIVECAAEGARREGLAMTTLTGAGHTGRLGAFAEEAAEAGCITIVLGGGDRKRWRMAAPHGGRKALLPTNPYCIGIPGGARGPVVLDVATSMLAGGWIYAAREAGLTLPEGTVINHRGAPTVAPTDYFDGGAILPKGGHLGYGLARIAELVGEAMLGPVVRGEINWMALAVHCHRERAPEAMRTAAEEILSEMRACPPAPGIERVEVPGERERDSLRRADAGSLRVPTPIWARIEKLERTDASKASA